MAPVQVVAEKQPDKVRLTMLDSTRVELSEPRVVGPEIVGKWDWTGKWDGDAGRIPGEVYWCGADHAVKRVPIDSISYVETREFDVTGTIALTGALTGAFTAVVAVLIALHNYDPWGGWGG
jgi:hypothetical protein